MKTSPEEQKYLSLVLVDSYLCPTLEGPTGAPGLIIYPGSWAALALPAPVAAPTPEGFHPRGPSG